MGLPQGPGGWRGAWSARTDPAAADRERGSFSLMLVVMTVALLALAGLVVDGGTKLDEAENANAVAEEAAQAGAGMVNQGNAYSTGAFTVDQNQALAAARAYLASVAGAGYTGSVTAVGTDSIRVTVTATQPTRILSIIGIDSMTATGSATASLVTGVTGPGT